MVQREALPATSDSADSGTPAPTRRSGRAWGLRVMLALPYLLLAGTLIPITVNGTLDVVGPFIGAMTLTGLVLTVMAARRTPGRAARPWWLLFLSWILLTITSAGFAVSGFGSDNGLRPASGAFIASMIVRIAFGVVLCAGLVSFGNHLHGRARWRLVADAVTLTGAGLMVMWYFLLGPALSVHESIGMARLNTIFLPISDLTLVLATVVVLLSGSRLTTRRALILLLGGVVTFLFLDSLLVAEILYESLVGIPGRVKVFLFDLPSFLFAAAAAEHCRTVVKPDSITKRTALAPVTWLPQAGLMGGFGLLAAIASMSGLYPWPGLIAGAIVMTLGVAARQSLAVHENRELALTDVLTRLPNRASFTELLDATLTASHRTGAPAAVLLIDLNQFKPINDQYGHEAGDEVLVAFAAILKSSIRRADDCARLGGDEFAVIIRGIPTSDDVCGAARRILAALAATPVVAGGHTFALRASIGIAVTGAGVDSAPVCGATMLRRADEAMYTAKRARATGWHLWRPGTTGEPKADSIAPSLVDSRPSVNPRSEA